MKEPQNRARSCRAEVPELWNCIQKVITATEPHAGASRTALPSRTRCGGASSVVAPSISRAA
ncbi:hypothetical protein C5E14_10225 [Rathayibacter sp. AY1A1]|nr:hypothetical protein C5E14_10225 [Rathayibacter sp. AY1A1]PPH03034.1 hypothetical protein C5C32_00420 [Rathayibacter sp. AY1G9]